MTDYQAPDNPRKRFVAILNKKVEPGRLMNALGHMSVGLAGGNQQNHDFAFWNYKDKDGGIHPNLSYYPFIVLRAKNSNQIRTVREMAIEKGISYSDFTQNMTIGTPEEQVDSIGNDHEQDLEYFGLLLFGEEKELYEMTKKFSLFQ